MKNKYLVESGISISFPMKTGKMGGHTCVVCGCQKTPVHTHIAPLFADST